MTPRGLFASFASLVLALCTTVAHIAYADQAPMWESPVGLAPGAPGSRVQMSAEDVHIRVHEKDDKIYASVDAIFDMLNPGENAQMLVGFPSFASSAIPDNIQQPYSPVMFLPSSISNFRASSTLGQYSASARRINSGQFSQTDWYVWSMLFPAGRPLRVQVSYDQQLDGSGWAPVSYVLRTGALWDGPIGRATITMTAADGGGLIGGVPTPQTADDGLIWSMTDFKPTEDIDATYIQASRWKTFQPAVAAASAPSPSSDDLTSGAAAVLDVMFGSLRASFNGRSSLRGQPSILAEHYFPLARTWAQLATEIDPSSSAAWELVGDIGATTATSKLGWLDCWPAFAVAAYQQAAELGSASAEAKNQELADTRDEQILRLNNTPQDCV